MINRNEIEFLLHLKLNQKAKPMSAFEEVSQTYEVFGEEAPFYAVLSLPEFQGDRLNKSAFFETGREHVATLLGEVNAQGIEIPRKRALDFGCGVGRLTNALCEHFESVVGVDISSSMVKNAQTHTPHDNVEFIVNKREDLVSLNSASFDFVLSDITLQHIPSPASENYIREFVRLLTNDGLALFLVPDGPNFRPNSLGYRVNRFYREKFRPWHKRIRGKLPVQIHYISEQRVRKLVSSNGGEVVYSRPLKPNSWNFLKHPVRYYWVKKSQ